MTYLYLFTIYAQSAAALGRLFSPGRFGAAAALAAVLGLLALMPPGTSAAHAQAAVPAPTPTAVNINSADAQTLAASLRGVGQSRAVEIVRYRETYGPFKSVDELAEVRGIGQSTLDENRALITLE